ncbi:MAG TPA: hypothetical protein VGO47_02745, partial [Chlamydiales bacterium]|nr:hypothetical protein [Chlamydiales bacterium]
MFIEPIHTEYVFNASEEMLRSHFNSFFTLFCENQDDPNASSQIIDGLARHVSNIPSAALNAVVGTPENNADASIEEQVAIFKKLELPFVWYVDESTDPIFKTKLIEHGFQELGIYQGVMKDFDEPFSNPNMPEGCTIEIVKTEEAMEAFNELVCATFGIEGESKNL